MTYGYFIEITKSPYGFNVTTNGLVTNRVFDADSHVEAKAKAKAWGKELGFYIHDES